MYSKMIGATLPYRREGFWTSGVNSTFGQATAAINISSVSTPLPPPDTQIFPILAVGNGQFDLAARAGIALQGVTRHHVAADAGQLQLVQSFAGDAAFYAYAPGPPAPLNVASASGDVTLNTESLGNVPIVPLLSADRRARVTRSPLLPTRMRIFRPIHRR